jgi:hypothetical protein
MASHFDLDRLLEKTTQHSLEQALRTSAPNLSWQIRPAASLRDLKHDHGIIITISAFRFRLYCLLHLSLKAPIRQFVADCTGVKAADLNDNALIDYLLELSNSFSGNIKRNIQETCPPLGMSTPNLLGHGALLFDSVLKCDHQAHVSAYVASESLPLISASCLISRSHEVELELPEIQESDTSFDTSGELELF